MSNCLKRNLLFLQFLNESTNDKQIQALLKNITPDQIKAFAEISNHLICGHCKLDKRSRAFLRKKVNILKKMASTKYSHLKKKKFVNQKGGGGFQKVIPVIIKAILPSLLALL